MPGQRPKLLIVDDDPGMRSQLYWGIEGYEIITADSRHSALEQFDTHQPPLVTLDLGLPPHAQGTSEGYAVLAAILDRAPDTQVLIVSGSSYKDNAHKAISSGAFDFVPKPVQLEGLQALINEAFLTYNAQD